MKIRLPLAAAAALVLAACGDADEAEVTDKTGAMADQAALPPAQDADAAMPTTAQPFVDAVAASDMYEIEAGRLAQQSGTTQEVRDFGARMVEDHKKSTADLKTAAAGVSGVVVNPELTAKHQSDLEALRNAGANFDKVYAQQQVAAHQNALSLLRNFAERGDFEPLKEFAAKTASIVEGHHQRARDLP